MDTGYPHPLMLLPHPPLRRKRPCPVPTPEIASHLETEVERAAALKNVAGATDLLRETVHSKGVTAVASGLPLDLDKPRGTDIIEMLLQGGEARPRPLPPPMNYYVRLYLFGRRTFERTVYYESSFRGCVALLLFFFFSEGVVFVSNTRPYDIET